MRSAAGFMEIVNNRVTMLVDTAEQPEEIDIRRAEEAKERAEEQLRQKQRHPGILPLTGVAGKSYEPPESIKRKTLESLTNINLIDEMVRARGRVLQRSSGLRRNSSLLQHTPSCAYTFASLSL